MVTWAPPGALSVSDAATRRRSIRQYDAGPIPRVDLEEIVRVAGLAPSAFNLQPWRFVIVESAGIRAALVEAAHRQRQVASAPAVIVLYTDTAGAIDALDDVLHPSFDATQREKTRASIERFFSGLTADEREAWGSQQGAIALGYLLLAAAERGYQTSPLQGFDAGSVKAALGLPAHVRIPALVAIGHGTEDGRPHHRQPLDRILRFA